MSDIRDKILSQIKQHPEYVEDIVLEEMGVMESIGVLNDVYAIYKKTLSENIIFTQNNLNSYIAFLLGITVSKPTKKFSLSKRRTYARPGFPDIDMDFDYLRRNEIINYLVKKYGRECVGNIGTILTLKTKAAVRRAIKILDVTNSVKYDSNGKQIKNDINENFILENEILETLPNLMKKADGELIKNVKEACQEYPSFNTYMEKYPEIKTVASAFEGLVVGYSRHAAGIVLSPVPLSSICPLHYTTEKAVEESEEDDQSIATQFTMSDVEKLGLIKFDVLGLSTLTALNMCVNLIEQGLGYRVNWDSIPLDDKKTFDLLSSGKTDGIFQAENHGMQQTFREIRIDSFNDIVVAIAMYRPGPKQYISEYASRKNGKSQIRYLDPKLKEITKETYSIICFQEQVMRVFVDLSGLTESDGYMFIKGCAKKKSSIIESYKDKFIKGCLNNGIGKEVVQKIWQDIYKFSQYAFNKSHALSYAYLCYQTAYLKAHYPTEFIAARLTVETIRRKFDEARKYELDAIYNFGFKIDAVDLNRSKIEWQILGDRHLLRPMVCKGIGSKAAQSIIDNQPYEGKDILYEFTKKAGSLINTKVIEAMREIGLWDMGKAQLIKKFESIKKDIKHNKGKQMGDIFQ